MQKIDKSVILSKEYKDWLDSLKADKHPKYNSSSNKYYFDIKMSLLYCQNGLCAYTEQRLCDNSLIQSDKWNERKYAYSLLNDEKNSIQGDLEHFNESLKDKNGWLWDNMFVVNTHVNCRIKGKKPVKNILKPDDSNYSPEEYLIFDYDAGVFAPNPNLSEDKKRDVKYMIETLGINCIANQRKQRLKEWRDRLEVGLDVEANEYITAWKMINE